MPELTLHVLLPASLAVLGVLIALSLVRAFLGPQLTDRSLAVNMIGTFVVLFCCILACLTDRAPLLDVALVYALLYLLAVEVMARAFLVRRSRRKRKGEEARHD